MGEVVFIEAGTLCFDCEQPILEGDDPVSFWATNLERDIDFHRDCLPPVLIAALASHG